MPGIEWSNVKMSDIQKSILTDVQERPLANGKVSVRKLSGAEKQLGSDVSKEVNKLYCPSYFAREKIDKLFN